MSEHTQAYMEEATGRPEVLRIEDLHTYFNTRDGEVRAVNGVNLSLKENSVLGVVGESGSGKSVTALSLLRLVPHPGKIVRGAAYFQGVNLLEISDEHLLQLRGRDIAMIFQDARASLNPLMTIGYQLEEALLAHSPMAFMQARERAMGLLREMDLPEPVHKQFPHQLSGGMAQRAMIAMATAWQPKILIADEPTSNLDMTIQADVLARLQRLRAANHSSMILITHSMGVIAQMAEEVAVMYAGTVVEQSNTLSLFHHPYHPYTWALFQAIPRLDEPERALRPIRGTAPDPMSLPDQCAFMPRCPKATNDCRLSPKPAMREIEPDHYVACYNEMTHD